MAEGHETEHGSDEAPDEASRYHAAQRSFQDRFDTRRLADRLAETTKPVIGPKHKAFIERRDMFFLATADSEGWPQCSYKGGEPGFVRVLDETTLAFPSYDGNGMYLSAGNVLVNPAVGTPLRRLRGRYPSASERRRVNRRGRPARRDLSGRAVRRARARAPGLRELPALRPPLSARPALALRALRRGGATRPGLEARGVVRRNAPCGRPGTRRGPAERPLDPSVLSNRHGGGSGGPAWTRP